MMGQPSDTPLNYLAHAHLHLDRPWFVAGTALPDWLSASDRPTRIHRDRLPHGSDLAAGIIRHFEERGSQLVNFETKHPELRRQVASSGEEGVYIAKPRFLAPRPVDATLAP